MNGRERENKIANAIHPKEGNDNEQKDAINPIDKESAKQTNVVAEEENPKASGISDAIDFLKNSGTIIKTRNDNDVIWVDKDGTVQNIDECDWGLSDDKKVTNSIFRQRIEPWLTSLFQSEHLSLLCGSGLTNAISYKAGADGGANMRQIQFNIYKTEIANAAKTIAKTSGRQ